MTAASPDRPHSISLVTGAAGFVGSHVCAALGAAGTEVVAVDCYTPYYDRAQKLANAAELGRAGIEIRDVDLLTADLDGLLEGVDVVYHQAAQPGVRASWSEGFDTYVTQNVLVTQRLLEAARRASLTRFVYASSSSVYGNAPRYPCTEEELPRPFSPYGVTKLAAEQLCTVYAQNWGVPTVSLRYFTVYGPRQRPDMAMHRLFEAALAGKSFGLYGSGEQIRDFTYVEDVVAANLAAATAAVDPGTVINVAGGSSVTMLDVVALIDDLVGRPLAVEHLGVQAGDVFRTGGSTERAQRILGWSPRTSLRDGLAAQLAWHRARLAS